MTHGQVVLWHQRRPRVPAARRWLAFAESEALFANESLGLPLVVLMDATDEDGPADDIGNRARRLLNFYQAQNDYYDWQRGQRIAGAPEGSSQEDLTGYVHHTTFDTSKYVLERVATGIVEAIVSVR